MGRRWLAGATGLVAVAGAAVAGIAVAGSTPQPAPAAAASRTMHTITLVTGDRVTVSGDGEQVSAEAGAGRTGVVFSVASSHGHVRVVPSDAAPLLVAGRLDPRLFDVTGLITAGYDRRDTLPLILASRSGTGNAPKAVTGLAKTAGLPAVHGMAVRQPRAQAARTWKAMTATADTKVWLDATLHPTLDVSVPQIGAPAAWSAGYTGTGVRVAVLDTGIDDTHPDLAGTVVARQNFTDGEPDADTVGHGTHVAATIASSGAAENGRYKGVAPGAKLLDGKVCAEYGCLESSILAGMTWAAADEHAQVVNLSLGGDDDPAVTDPLEAAVQTLSDQYGTLFVIAAGNTDGSVVHGDINSPGSAAAALTVGAVDRNNQLAGFSLRGPTTDGRLKPDLTAPGVNITAARAAGAAEVPGNPGDPYTTLSGTSMATPHVAGAAAILAQQHPDWSGSRIKAALMASAAPTTGAGVYDQGAGRVDVARAITQTVTTTPTAVDFGTQQWPHQDDEVRDRTLTYHNDGPADVTLTLSLDSPTFAVSPATLRVPAGGDATAHVTADTRVAGPDGYLGAEVTATAAGGTVVRTPAGVVKEVESYDVTLVGVDRKGGVPRDVFVGVSKRDVDDVQDVMLFGNPEDRTTVRVPKGHYSVIGAVDTLVSSTTGDDGRPVETYDKTVLARPDLDVDRPVTVTLDARLGRPVTMTVPKADATQVFARISARTLRDKWPASLTVLGTSFANLYTAALGPGDDRFSATVAGQWARPDTDSPYLYSVSYPIPGSLPTGYSHRVEPAELATVTAQYARTFPGETGWVQADIGAFLNVTLPLTRTEYYNNGTQHLKQYGAGSPDGGAGVWGFSRDLTVYQPGHHYRERWNNGVFAPAFAAIGWSGVTRSGHYLWLDTAMYGDGQGRPAAGNTTATSATLYRGDTRVTGTSGPPTGNVPPNLRIPDEDDTYRLVLHNERGAPFTVSTSTDIAWTFRSALGDPDATTVLPLWAVQFDPPLDRNNQAPATATLPVKVTANPQPGAAVGTLAHLTVAASLDDGHTWRPVPVTNGVALVPQPGGNGHVSLRGRATDSEGNAVTVTIIRAYGYGPPA